MKTILVIGADAIAATKLKHRLDQVGHLATVVSGADDAMSALSHFHVDVVVSEVGSADDEGLTAIRAISQTYPRTRIVAIAEGRGGAAAAAAAERLDAARSSGAHQTLRRPFRTRELLKAVGCRVLVVDDEPDIRAALMRVLERAGFEVSTASNGMEAVLHLRQHNVELVVTDVVMPLVNGIELIRTLSLAMPQVRIVAISGGGVHGAGIEPGSAPATSAWLSAARSAGAHAILTKPFGVRDILSASGHGEHDDA